MRLCLPLTFGTGIVDAVGYLGLDRVFTGNMTGNVVILGMALVGGDDLPILGPVLALLGFLGGAVVAAVTVALAVALLVAGEEPAEPLALCVTTLLGAAMGLQAATARFIAVKDVTTVVVTSTITGLAADSVLGSGSGRSGSTARRILAVLLILAGAAVGATTP